MDGGAWWATVHGRKESDTTERLHFHFHFEGGAGDEGSLGVRVLARKGLDCQVGNYGIWPPFAGREPREEAAPTTNIGSESRPS